MSKEAVSICKTVSTSSQLLLQLLRVWAFSHRVFTCLLTDILLFNRKEVLSTPWCKNNFGGMD